MLHSGRHALKSKLIEVSIYAMLKSHLFVDEVSHTFVIIHALSIYLFYFLLIKLGHNIDGKELYISGGGGI